MGQIKIIVVTKSEKNQISNFQEKQNNEMHLEKSKDLCNINGSKKLLDNIFQDINIRNGKSRIRLEIKKTKCTLVKTYIDFLSVS